jgi:chromosome segregation ATPase
MVFFKGLDDMSTTVSELLNKMQAVREQRKSHTYDDYMQLVRATGSDQEVSPEDAAVILDGAGFTCEQLAADADNYANRVELRRKMDAMPEHVADQAQVQTKLDAFLVNKRRVLDELVAEENALQAEHGRLTDAVTAAKLARRNLVSTAWPHLTTKIAELRQQARPNFEERQTLEQHIKNLGENAESLERTITLHHQRGSNSADIAKLQKTIDLQRQRIAEAEHRLAASKATGQPLQDQISKLEGEMLEP